MGFLNLYIAAGLSFFLPLVWRGEGWELALVLPLLGLIWFGHMLAFAWSLSVGAYICIARKISLPWHGALVACFAARHYVIHHYLLPDRLWNESWLVGAEQLYLYNSTYCWLAVAVLLVSFLFVVGSLVHDFPTTVLTAAVPLGVYLVTATAVYFAPDGVWLPSYGAPFTLAADRLSLLAAVFACCTIAACGVGRAQCAIYACLALAFFGLLYHDTGIVDRMETNVERLVSDLPKNSRVVGTLKWPGSHIGVGHVVDRACIGRCFSYANYEPGSRHFRVRALPGNRFVTADSGASVALQAGLGDMRFPSGNCPYTRSTTAERT